MCANDRAVIQDQRKYIEQLTLEKASIQSERDNLQGWIEEYRGLTEYGNCFFVTKDGHKFVISNRGLIKTALKNGELIFPIRSKSLCALSEESYPSSSIEIEKRTYKMNGLEAVGGFYIFEEV